jgi:hypothetical protein
VCFYTGGLASQMYASLVSHELARSAVPFRATQSPPAVRFEVSIRLFATPPSHENTLELILFNDIQYISEIDPATTQILAPEIFLEFVYYFAWPPARRPHLSPLEFQLTTVSYFYFRTFLWPQNMTPANSQFIETDWWLLKFEITFSDETM